MQDFSGAYTLVSSSYFYENMGLIHPELLVLIEKIEKLKNENGKKRKRRESGGSWRERGGGRVEGGKTDKLIRQTSK